jgi:predicted PurR-regulated permease PerM
MDHGEMHQRTFLLLLILVSLAFGWVLLPFFDSVFWALVLAIVFAPVYRRLLKRLRGRRNLAAITTLLLCLLIVVLPLTLIGNLLLREGVHIYEGIASGRLDLGIYLQKAINLLPAWLIGVLDRQGLTELGTLQERLSGMAMQGSQYLFAQAVNVGQNTFWFLTNFVIMLYLLFFLLRDNAELSTRIQQALPLSEQHKRRLFAKFTVVIRATIKGNFVVAAAQGTLGGMIFAFLGLPGAVLWGAVMAFLSLIPAAGPALLWAPVALYLLLTGALWKGLVLIGFGVLAIGLIDNLLRPLLVGRDTKMPDYVVLISTVGGLALFGLSGFIIGPVIAALFISTWDLFAPVEDVPEA